MSDERMHHPKRALLTPKEAAHMLSIGRTTLYELLGQGKLPAIKIGRLQRIPQDELEAFIARQQHVVQATGQAVEEEG